MTAVLQALIDVTKQIAQAAIMPRFLQVSVQRKIDGSLLTDADLACQQALVQILPTLLPYPVLGEEMEENDQARLWAQNQNGLWVVDPIDGTTNFANGLPFFALSIAFMRNGRTELGVIYNPATDELFYASKGQGAYLNQQRLPLIQRQKTMGETIAGIDFKYIRSGRLASRLGSIAPYGSLRNLGSSTLDWCYLASGRYDLYLHGGQRLWDYAAGALIFEEAGGQLSTLEGGDYWQGPIWRRSTIAAIQAPLFQQWQTWILQNH